jgi:hypothetical protein
MERLELSKQKLLEPKPSASTNFATSAISFKSIYLNKSLEEIFLKIYSSSIYILYTKLVVLPRNIDLAKDKDF